ncbi:unnamed protein product [Dibothriocephalus latus]|uniref:BAR domain-containing protein n=1 Tax=Dibothriocephalus latus TaxID=60516 RepID=A0A3P7QK36_DIBLA|nr:unnamed protein product [Dibothriocephalus latus]
MQNLNSILVFPMETFLQSDLKSDLKKPFEKALKEYEYKYEKLRKEKIQAMKESGIYMPDVFTAEMAADLEKERRRLQLEVCEYLIKVNEVKSKKGADFLQHFIDFYHAHLQYVSFFISSYISLYMYTWIAIPFIDFPHTPREGY